MIEDNNNLPILPQGEEIEALEAAEFLPQDEWKDISIEKDWLDVTEPYEPPQYSLSCRGVPFAPLGGLQVLTGQAGHGKTMTFTQIMVAILKGRYGILEYKLGNKIEKPKVLYIDTEMEKGNTQLVNMRVYSLMDWTFGEYHDEFRIIMLRETEKVTERWKKVLKAIYEVRPTVCFVDGLLDVVADFNDNAECSEIVYKCMLVASHYNIGLWCLVHENPSGNKMVGHLGSILARKATDIWAVRKIVDSITGEVHFEVEQKKARGKDIKTWKFGVFDDIFGLGSPRQLEEWAEAEEIKENPRQREINELNNRFQGLSIPREGTTYKDIERKFIAQGITSKRAIQKMVNEAIGEGILTRPDGKRIYYKGLNGGRDETEDAMPF